MRRKPTQYHVLQNVLVRNGSIVLFMDSGKAEASVWPKALRVYLWDRAKADDVALHYETVLPGVTDPYSMCASSLRQCSKTCASPLIQYSKTTLQDNTAHACHGPLCVWHGGMATSKQAYGCGLPVMCQAFALYMAASVTAVCQYHAISR